MASHFYFFNAVTFTCLVKDEVGDSFSCLLLPHLNSMLLLSLFLAIQLSLVDSKEDTSCSSLPFVVYILLFLLHVHIVITDDVRLEISVALRKFTVCIIRYVFMCIFLRG